MRNTTPLCSIKFRRWLSKLCTNYFFPETATQFFSTKDNRLLQAAINLHIVHKIHRTLGRKQSSSYFNIWENSIWRGNKKIMLVYLLLLNYIKSQKKKIEKVMNCWRWISACGWTQMDLNLLDLFSPSCTHMVDHCRVLLLLH